MHYTVVWYEQDVRCCLPYSCFTDALEHQKYLISQNIACYMHIEELN